MNISDEIRAIVREEIRAALADLRGPLAAAPEPDLIALGEVRHWVQVSKTTLKTWIKAGRLPKYGQGRMLRVKLAEVRAVLESRTTATRPPKAGRTSTSADVQRILASVPGGR